MPVALPSLTVKASIAGLMVLLLLVLLGRPAAAAGLQLELNKAEDSAQGCLATVLIGNQSGQTLDRFRLDLVLFNGKGVLFDRLLIDLAPLPADRTTVASFPLHRGRCDEVTRILLRDVPACRAQSAGSVDCLNGLTVSSRAAIGFGK